MREKYDKQLKNYYFFAVIYAIILIANQFVAFLEIATTLFSMIFGLVSIAVLVRFVSKEYKKELNIVPLFTLASFILYFSVVSLAASFMFLFPGVMFQLFGIMFGMALIVYSGYVLFKYRR